MKVLVVGSGGREHALVWRLARDPMVEAVFAAPGNPGMQLDARCFPVKADDIEGLLALAKEFKADLTVVGPEAPLVAGLADRFREAGLSVFGPGRQGALLEGSKAFAKEIMQQAEVPTASYREFSRYEEAKNFVEGLETPPVIKADGLAAGKGVIVPNTKAEALQALAKILVEKQFGDAGGKVVVEERLRGKELSLLALCSGENYLLFPTARDHKAAFEGGRGSNTGGMGAFAPVPEIPPAEAEEFGTKIFPPVLRELKHRGIDYRGVLYAGLMLTDSGPMVLEFNVRFGDPETQALLPLIKGNFALALLAAARGEKLPSLTVRQASCLCLAVVSGGYPGKYEKGKQITIDPSLSSQEGLVVFHAGTALDGSNRLITSGGRVLGITASGPNLETARKTAYTAAKQIKFEGMRIRTDIGI